MDNQFEINASVRTEFGTSASRRLRKSDKVPGVLYGGDGSAVSLTLDHKEVWTHLQHEAFHSHILNLKVDGKQESVVLRDVQYHPFKPKAQHLDFLRVVADHALRMTVPIHFVGEDVAVGVKQGGGVVAHHESEVEIECLPKDLPEYIEVDISGLDVDDAVRLSELKLPGGVTIPELDLGPEHDRPVVSVYIPKVAAEPTDGEEAEAAADAAAADSGSEAEASSQGD